MRKFLIVIAAVAVGGAGPFLGAYYLLCPLIFG